MKKFPLVFLVLASIFYISCRHFGNDISITDSESARYYSMKAHYKTNRTRDVEEYLDSRIGSGSNMSFVNTRIDGQLALDDHTTFYIKKYPGFIEIKIDKSQNSNEACQRIKSMCEGIKQILAK